MCAHSTHCDLEYLLTLNISDLVSQLTWLADPADPAESMVIICRDAMLLELTFASIWLAQCLRGLQQKAAPSTAQQQPSLSTHAVAAQPTTLSMQWLLFKVLLLSSSSRTNIVCSAVRGVTNCHRAMVAHGQPSIFTWWLQSSANPLAPALSLLELPAAFLALCPSPDVQQLLSKLLLAAQLLKACLGTMTLADAAVAVLCLTMMNDSVVAAALQWVKGLYAGKQAASPAGDETAAVGAAGAELLAYKPNGNHKRSPSNDSLASLLSEPDLQLPANPRASQQQAGPLSSRTSKTLLGVAVVYLILMLSSDTAGYTVLRWTPEQITAVLHVLVPIAAALWLAKLAYVAWHSCKDALAEAAVLAATEAAEAVQRAAAVETKPQAGSSQSAATPAAKPQANGLTGDMTSAGGEALDLDSVQASLPAIATKAASDTDAQAAKPARRARTATVKAASEIGTPRGTPRKGRVSKAAASQDDNEAPDAPAEDSAATGTPKGARGKRTAAARGRKTAAAAVAPISEDGQGADGAAEAATFFTPEPAVPAAGTPAAAAPETPAVLAETPATAARPAPPATAAQGKAAVTPAPAAAEKAFDLGTWLRPRLNLGCRVLPAVALLALFCAGLPAVLAPAGYTQQSLQAIPGLVSSYKFVCNHGMVSSGDSLLAALEATAIAAEQIPGSYLVYEFSTSQDNVTWQPVVFKQVLTTEGPGLASLRGLHEPRLQGRMLAAGIGDLTDNRNLWLLNLADKILEGSPELNAVLAEPAAQHEWVKIDLMSYTPSSVAASTQPATVTDSSSKWVVQHVFGVLPAMSRGDQDLKEALAALHWGASGSRSACTASVLGVPPQVLIPLLLLGVVSRHILLPGGPLHDLTG
eukprot:GHUV01055437.1.p1 GENE.GHUV01055437.1~~GHUV01055437.1.p1  ORF type:complete len:868 (+),score=324.75 GHUV01055437.1:1533-4136(+)